MSESMASVAVNEVFEPVVEPPEDAPLELDRLRRNVHAQLFGGDPEPTRIGRFRLLQCIGRGGMGVVWSARDEELDRTVAIKLLRPELGGARLTDEARALARLAHPNVVSVFDVGVHAGQRFLAMEYVDGVTLRHWLVEPRSAGEVVEMFVAAGQGLAAAHAVGLVHRDFKPDNVLVGGDGRPRVLDFGLARPPDAGAEAPPSVPLDADPLATTMTHAGLLIGTPAYMAPEQHLGEPADARSDQFAFAVALFEGLTGSLPFPGEDLRTLSLAVVRGRWAADSAMTIPAALREPIARALSVDPEARFASIEELLAALQAGVSRRSDAASAADPRFDTRQAERVLGRAAELAAASGRPRLSASEVEAVALEAGISADAAAEAVAEALAERGSGAGAGGPSSAGSGAELARVHDAQPALPALPVPSVDDGTFSQPVQVSRTLDRHPTPAVMQLIVRELDRRFGRGKSEQLGASISWSGHGVEVNVDTTTTGCQLVLRQAAPLAARLQPWALGFVGLILGVATVIPVMVEVLRIHDAIVVPFVFASMIGGALLGRRAAKRLHARQLEERRRQLDFVAGRLAALVESNTR